MRRTVLLTAMFLLVSLANFHTISAEIGGPVSGQTLGSWIIEAGDDLLYQDETVVVNGDLIIEDGGILRLKNMRIEMRGHGDNEQAANLTVEEGGTLLAVDTTITAHRNGTGGPNDFTEYKFEVYGSMILENCDVSKMWGLYDGYVIGPIESTHSEVHGGIQIFSDDVQILNSTISESQTSGIYIVDASPIITNCTISYNNRIGIWAGSRYSEQPELVQPHIHNNTFVSNEHGAMWFYYANAVVLDNTVNGGNGGIALSQGAEGTTLERAWIDGTIWRGLWFWVDAHTARDCTISNTQLADIELINTATPTVINVSFNRSKVSFQMDTSMLTVKNYLTIKVEDEDNKPIYGADVEVRNRTGQLVWTGTTNQYGMLGPELLEAYQQNRTLWWNSTPHNISVSKASYYTSEQVDLFPSQLVTIELDTGEDDFTSPDIFDLSPEDGSIVETPLPIIEAHYDDPSGIDLDSVELEIEGEPISNAIVTETMVRYEPIDMLDDGDYNIKVEVADNSENHNQAELSWEFTIDTSNLDRNSPLISNLTPEPDSIVETTTPKIGADYFDESEVDLDRVVLTLDGKDVTSSASIGPKGIEYTPSPLGAGTHKVVLQVIDKCVLKNIAVQTWNFSLAPDLFDTSPPEIYDIEPATGSVISILTPTISAKYSDEFGINIQTVKLVLDGEDVSLESQITESEVVFTPSSQLVLGEHLVELQVEDNSTNHNLAELSWSFEISLTADDHEPPIITGYEWLDGATIEDPRPEITLTLFDDSGIDPESIILLLDDEDVTEDAILGDSSLTFTPSEDLEPGSHTIEIKVKDASSNGNERVVSWSFTVAEEDEEGDEKDSEGFNSWWLLLAAIFLIIIVVILIVVFLFRGRPKEVQFSTYDHR